jgi:hypothetical protein
MGVLGPASNAHGPNEFLHIDFSLRLTCCVASILASHAASRVEAKLRADRPPQDDDGDSPADKRARAAAEGVDVTDLVTPATEKMER